MTIGSYGINNVTFKDTSGNEDTNQTTGFNFTVSSAPSVPSSGGGGGGGGAPACQEGFARNASGVCINITELGVIVVERVCNFNNICEAFRGEDFINCGNDKAGFWDMGGDCAPEFGALLCGDPTKQCIWKFGLVFRIINILMGLAIVALITISLLPKKDFEKLKSKTKDVFKNVRF